MRDIIATYRALHRWSRSKPPAIRSAAIILSYHLIAIARSRSSPQLHAAMKEKIDRLQKCGQAPINQL